MGPHGSTRHHTVPHCQVGPTPSSFLPAPPPAPSARTAARSLRRRPLRRTAARSLLRRRCRSLPPPPRAGGRGRGRGTQLAEHPRRPLLGRRAPSARVEDADHGRDYAADGAGGGASGRRRRRRRKRAAAAAAGGGSFRVAAQRAGGAAEGAGSGGGGGSGRRCERVAAQRCDGAGGGGGSGWLCERRERAAVRRKERA